MKGTEAEANVMLRLAAATAAAAGAGPRQACARLRPAAVRPLHAREPVQGTADAALWHVSHHHSNLLYKTVLVYS